MGKRLKNISLCPYLRGNIRGVMCGAANELVKNIEESDMKLCMSRQYEVCIVYRSELQNCYRESFPRSVIETDQ